MAKKYRITDAEAAKVLIKNVNDRPNALATYGEAKKSPTQVKDLFDRQFLLVKEKHEALADVVEEIEESIGEMADRVSGLEEKMEGLDVGKFEETDPTVPAWAKQPKKPDYTAEEVGAAEYYWTLDAFSGIRLEVNGNGKKINAVSDEMNRQYVELEMLLSQLEERLSAVANRIPTKTSDISNDSGFITKAVSDLANYYTKSQTFTRDEINAKISAIPKFSISVVSSLPTSKISETTIYLVGGGSGSNLYTEYIYVNGEWEYLGAQTVDLTGYATEAWVNVQLASYLKRSELNTAINAALATAKASGEFDGAPGKTPVKGTDYFTPAEISEFVNNVIAKLPIYNGEAVVV